MQEYEFTLKFALPDSSEDPVIHVDRLAVAGCDDALVGVGQSGRLALNFIRLSSSALEAIAGAYTQVNTAIPGARLVEVAPDFVGLTDVAELLKVSRQYMRKLRVNNPVHFPTAVHEGNTAIWHLYDLLLWLRQNKGYTVDDTLLDVAAAAMQLNLAREMCRVDAGVQKTVQTLVG
jgi:hypothetical protein